MRALLSIAPGVSLGPYQLGDELNETLDRLDKAKETHTIKHNQAFPLSDPIVITTSEGVDLVFSPLSHRLYLIEVPDVAACAAIAFEGLPLFGPQTEPHPLASVAALFGPCTAEWRLDQPSSGDSSPLLVREHAGAALFFQEAVGAKAAVSQTLCRRLALYPMGCGLRDAGGKYAPRIVATVVRERGESKRTCVTVAREGTRPVVVSDITTPQDLATDFGPPDAVFERTDGTGDQYHNYYALGIDLLVDGSLHTVKRCVLHANLPDDPQFGRYTRVALTLDAASFTPPRGNSGGGRKGGGSQPVPAVLGHTTRWAAEAHSLGMDGPAPAPKGLGGPTTGASSFYRLDNVIVETCNVNGYAFSTTVSLRPLSEEP